MNWVSLRKLKIITVVTVICSFVLLQSCRHNEVLFKSRPLSESKVKAWLRINGGNYKNETIVIKAPNGDMLTGLLNWKAAQQYIWEGKEYLDIPFLFAGNSTKVGGNDSIAPAGFNMVIRQKGTDDFEGAIRTTMYGAKAENLTAGGAANTITQSYQLINGDDGNIWQGNLKAGDIKAVKRLRLSTSEIATMKASINRMRFNKHSEATETTSTSAATDCITYTYTTYETYCYYASPEDYAAMIATCYATPHVQTVTSCITSGDNPPGGGYPPGGGTSPPVNDPCADAAAAALAITNTSNIQLFREKFFNLTKNIAVATVERGFAFMENVKVDPFDPNNVTVDHYYAGETQIGSATDINIPVTTNNLNGLVGTVHIHPSAGYSPPSATDVYAVINSSEMNIGPFTQNSFQGNFVAGADGSVYALTVTDASLAHQFLSTESVYRDGRKWKEDSEIGKAFEYATRYFNRQYRGQSNKDNIVFENATAAVLNKFNTGVTLMKKDAATGTFKPILQKETVTQNGNGKPKITYSNPCP